MFHTANISSYTTCIVQVVVVKQKNSLLFWGFHGKFTKNKAGFKSHDLLNLLVNPEKGHLKERDGDLKK
jgi:hypothetical protein